LTIFIAAGSLLFASPAMSQPPNLGDLKAELTSYHDFGGYERELAAADSAARAYLDAHVRHGHKPAIVLDIDETSLSNWVEIKADDFGYVPGGACAQLPAGPCGALAWDTLSLASGIAPTLALFNDAKSKRVAVFFVTGRHEAERAVTEKNLTNAGFHGWAKLLMEPDGAKFASASDFKAPERGKIVAEGYEILVNVGDQPSDLLGGFADHAFLLPNPFYRIP
jgi:acid phosphatase